MERSDAEFHVDSGDGIRQGGPRLPSRRLLGIILGVYWVNMFLVTHVNLQPPGPSVPDADKIAHFVGYCGLGTLLSLWVVVSRRLTLKVILGTLLTIATYGLADELLQIPVGRDCDVRDWVADMLGASCGVGLAVIYCRRSERR
ncbi:MAG: VanZ family protein [Planctomycetaceae bacterium]|nr:VanZ family protein [Planctomycetaceae bacterium]